VIKVLAAINDKAAVKGLTGALKNPELQQTAGEALTSIGWEPKSTQEQLLYYCATRKPDQLVALGEPAVESIKALLYGEDEDFALELLQALSRTDEAAFKELLREVIEDDEVSQTIGEAATVALGRIACEQGCRKCKHLHGNDSCVDSAPCGFGFQSLDPDELLELAKKAATFGPKSLELIVALFCQTTRRESSKKERKLALALSSMLATFDDGAVIEPLVIAPHPSFENYEHFTEVFVDIGNNAVEPLVRLLNSPKRLYRSRAALALRAIDRSSTLDKKNKSLIFKQRGVISANHFEHLKE
jgi:HEAT repeat protein